MINKDYLNFLLKYKNNITITIKLKINSVMFNIIKLIKMIKYYNYKKIIKTKNLNINISLEYFLTYILYKIEI